MFFKKFRPNVTVYASADRVEEMLAQKYSDRFISANDGKYYDLKGKQVGEYNEATGKFCGRF